MHVLIHFICFDLFCFVLFCFVLVFVLLFFRFCFWLDRQPFHPSSSPAQILPKISTFGFFFLSCLPHFQRNEKLKFLVAITWLCPWYLNARYFYWSWSFYRFYRRSNIGACYFGILLGGRPHRHRHADERTPWIEISRIQFSRRVARSFWKSVRHQLLRCWIRILNYIHFTHYASKFSSHSPKFYS